LHAVREAIRGMWRTRYMAVVSILTITIALVLLGIVGIVTIVANGLVSKVQKSEEVIVYFKDDMTDGNILALDQTIASMREVESTRIISKEEAAREFKEMFGSDLLAALEENPLPRSILVVMAEGYRSTPYMDTLSQRISMVQGVDSVEYGREWMSKVDIYFLVFMIVESIIIALILTAGILIISNTITLTLLARREAIEIMRLVGATERFIRRPYYIEGFLQGIISGMSAFLIFLGIYLWASYAVPDLDVYLYLFRIQRIQTVTFPWILGTIIPVGGFLGLLGSYVAVRRAL